MDCATGRYYRDYAAQLLRRVLEGRELDSERLAEELVATVNDLDAYRWGRIRMPRERQLCLALVVIERLPRLARAGHQLHAHVVAAIRYDAQMTAVHEASPYGWFRARS